MKKFITILAAIILVATSCKKETVLIDKNVTVKALVMTEKKLDGRTYYKPGVDFNKGINATGTATVRWFNGGSYGNPYYIYTKTFSWSVSVNSSSYTEVSDYKLPDPSFFADSARIIDFKLTTGDYNVTINNN